MTMQPDLRVEIALLHGDAVPADVALALRDDALMAHQAMIDARGRAYELALRLRSLRGAVEDFLDARVTQDDLAGALARDVLREELG